MEPYRNEGTDLLSSFNATVEDKRIYQNFQMQTLLRVNHIKVSGNKLELVKAIKDRSCTILHRSCQTSDEPVPDKDLDSGVTGKSGMFPKN